MSATVKLLATAALLAISVNQASAQASLTDMLNSMIGDDGPVREETVTAPPADDADSAPDMVSSTPVPAQAASSPPNIDMQSAILDAEAFDQAIAGLLDQVRKAAPGNTPGLTIEDLDAINRESQRRNSELELSKVQLEQVKVQLELLTTLRSAVITNQQAAAQAEAAKIAAEAARADAATRTENSSQNPGQSATGADPDATGGSLSGSGNSGTSAEEVRMAGLMEIEMRSIPRVREILGIGNNLEATLMFPGGTEITAIKGSSLPSGLQVTDITNRSITLTGSSGMTHVLIPGAGIMGPPMESDEDETPEAVRVDFPFGAM